MTEEKKGSEKLMDMVDRFYNTMEEIDRLSEQVESLKATLDGQHLSLIEALGNEDISRVTDTKGRTVYIKKPRFYASPKAELGEEAKDYIKKEWDGAYLFKEQVSASALGRVVRDRLEAGLEVDEKYVSYFAKNEIGHRAGKKSAAEADIKESEKGE